MSDWRDHAACRQLDMPYEAVDQLFFPTVGGTGAAAKRICRHCPVAAQCLDKALSYGSGLSGVWGGTAEQERRNILRDRGDTPAAPQKARKYTDQERTAAVDLYRQNRPAYAANWNCARAVSEHLGYGDPGSILNWVRHADQPAKATAGS